jgi:mannose/cellobiose epimerase-like protein (N-acyl-D-glucosamine 2-epimerase family)
MAGGDASSISVQKGIEYLVRTQKPDGTWDEELATGTGFPRVFYLCYHLYLVSFPLLALSTFLKANSEPDAALRRETIRIASDSQGWFRNGGAKFGQHDGGTVRA